jgi:HPt (histidine-containing phosphotransfer) domain-containing protein
MRSEPFALKITTEPLPAISLAEHVPGARRGQAEVESALCLTTLQSLRELGSDMGDSLFLTQLLDTFAHDAQEHLGSLRSAVAGADTKRLRSEAHALKGASLTIGAQGMAQLCQLLENLGTAQSVAGAPELLWRLDREFERVKNEIEQESLIP